MANKKVDVDLNLTPNFTTSISKGNNDKITWDAPNGAGGWLVVFHDESPFDEYFFHHGNKQSNTIVVDADPNKKYKYTVYLNAAFHVDPNVVIL